MKTKAIKHARNSVTLAQQGNQWRVDTYSIHHKAWWQGTPQGYWRARYDYAQALIDSAREFLDLSPTQYDGGKWVSYF